MEGGFFGGEGRGLQSKGVWETFSEQVPQLLKEGPNPTVCHIDEN